MLTSGDVMNADLGVPIGGEAGFPHPVIVVSAQAVLDQSPSVVQVVPLASTLRNVATELRIDPNGSGLRTASSAQCQHLRSISAKRLSDVHGNVGPVDLSRIREVIALLLDIG